MIDENWVHVQQVDASHAGVEEAEHWRSKCVEGEPLAVPVFGASSGGADVVGMTVAVIFRYGMENGDRLIILPSDHLHDA